MHLNALGRRIIFRIKRPAMKPAKQLPLIFAAVAICLLGGCASAPKTDPVAFTRDALTMTDANKSIVPQSIIERFRTFNSDFSESNITNETRRIYATDVYFRDPFKEIHSEAKFETYLLRGSSAVAAFSMEWLDVSESHGDYYFRWVMSVTLKRDGKNARPNLTTGISHVRFGPDGKVIFHQDYFDAAAFLYEKIPVLGSEIRFIKKRL